MVGAELLDREARLLVQRLRLWTPARWAAAGREAVAHHLAQVLADAAADLEGQPSRRMPVLDSPLALPDQLAVTADDVRRAGPGDDLARELTAHLLLHRHDLVDDEVPATLAQQLGFPSGDVLLAAARSACDSPNRD